MTFERRLWALGNFFAFALLLVSLRVVYWQLLRGAELQPVVLDPVAAAAEYAGRSPQEPGEEPVVAPGLEDLPQPVIQRTIDLLETITRGAIYDRGGRLLAEDRLGVEGERIRFYTEPSLAHAIGYVSGLRTGVSGLEASYNEVLLGLDRPDAQLQRLLNQPVSGSDLHLTVDSFLQRAAERELEGKAGAILVFEADTGAILAMASAPRFDPNRVLDEAYTNALLTACPGDPLCLAPFLNRATQALYPPGSTFKTVTLIAALDTGQVTPETVFDFGEPLSGPEGLYYVYTVDGGVIPDPNHEESRLDLPLSYAKSANAAFARIGDEMPADTLVAYAGRFGFSLAGENAYPLEFETSPAQLARELDDLYENNLLRAVTAIGQGELLAAPLHMGLVTLSVYNEGDLPLPYMVESIQRPTGSVLSNLPNRRTIRGLMETETARHVRDMMITVVEEGSGFRAAVSGLEVGGKTGTAQVASDRPPHAWFTGFAQDEEGVGVVIVVLVENGGEGSETAAPIFARMAQLSLESAGQPVEEIVPTPVPPTPAPPTPEAPPEEQAEEPVEPSETASPPETEPPPEADPDAPPPPDIPRDPDKADLTAGSTCPTNKEGLVGTGEFIWPSQYQALSGTDFMEGHPGIDLSTPHGVPIYAADSGLVIFAGWTGIGYGNTVLIDHNNGYQTLYGHLSQISIPCGSNVEKGQLIGLAGKTGNSSGPHLHFEVRVPGGYLNPLKVLPLP